MAKEQSVQELARLTLLNLCYKITYKKKIKPVQDKRHKKSQALALKIL